MSTTATGRMTLGAIFGAVSTTAGTIAGAVGTAGTSILMLDNYVKKQLHEQKLRHLVESDSFEERLAIEVSMENALMRIQADEFCDKPGKHGEHFNSSYQRIKALLASQKNA